MANCIVYPWTDELGVQRVALTQPSTPTEDVDRLLMIAHRTIPEGVPFLLVDSNTDLPPDHDFFNAWETSFDTPDGISMGREAWELANPTPERIRPNRPHMSR